jgi:hypothetical protein
MIHAVSFRENARRTIDEPKLCPVAFIYSVSDNGSLLENRWVENINPFMQFF